MILGRVKNLLKTLGAMTSLWGLRYFDGVSGDAGRSRGWREEGFDLGTVRDFTISPARHRVSATSLQYVQYSIYRLSSNTHPPPNFLHLQFCFRCHICTLRTRMRSRTSLLLSIYKKEKKENLKCTCQTISNSYWLMEQQAFSYNFSLLDNQMCDLSGVTSQRECHVFFVDGNVSLTPSKKYLVADWTEKMTATIWSKMQLMFHLIPFFLFI